ncbi:MAG TPA: peptidoglycan-binding domain-containing protein, partial [candidate division Zixibacteria bacterium]|nr:peptidoglycan-binding domain-containing protein [candidate division Zixibacteria bacterium]
MQKRLLSTFFAAAAGMGFGAAVVLAQSAGTGTKGPEDVPGSSQREDSSIGGTQGQRNREGQTPSPGAAREPERGPAEQSRGGRLAASREEVRQLQQALKEKGHDPGPIDGVMGQKTRDALMEFQRSNGLRATGTLGAETAAKLELGGSSAGSSDSPAG